ncbi:MAG: DUF3079 domain-containing protein [Vicinamibacterales bacterium]
MPKVPLAPAHPERTCWGCDLYCPDGALRCGNGTVRTMHPIELFGEGWATWADEHDPAPQTAPGASREI